MDCFATLMKFIGLNANSVVGTAAGGIVSVLGTDDSAFVSDVGGIASESGTSALGAKLVPITGGSVGISAPLSSIILD